MEDTRKTYKKRSNTKQNNKERLLFITSAAFGIKDEGRRKREDISSLVSPAELLEIKPHVCLKLFSKHSLLLYQAMPTIDFNQPTKNSYLNNYLPVVYVLLWVDYVLIYQDSKTCRYL